MIGSARAPDLGEGVAYFLNGVQCFVLLGGEGREVNALRDHEATRGFAGRNTDPGAIAEAVLQAELQAADALLLTATAAGGGAAVSREATAVAWVAPAVARVAVARVRLVALPERAAPVPTPRGVATGLKQPAGGGRQRRFSNNDRGQQNEENH